MYGPHSSSSTSPERENMAVGNVRNRTSTSPAFLPPARDDVPMVAVAHGTTHLPGLGEREAVVLPVFLSTGYHVRHDICEAVRATESRGFRVHTARALGP